MYSLSCFGNLFYQKKTSPRGYTLQNSPSLPGQRSLAVIHKANLTCTPIAVILLLLLSYSGLLPPTLLPCLVC